MDDLSASEKAVKASVAFLRRWRRDGVHALTAIDPDAGYIRTAGFEASDVDDFLESFDA